MERLARAKYLAGSQIITVLNNAEEEQGQHCYTLPEGPKGTWMETALHE